MLVFSLQKVEMEVSRLPHRGSAIGFALILALAAEHTAQRGRAVGPFHRSWRLQVNQVVVRLAHPRVLVLAPPAEEELGTLAKKTACE